MRACAICNKPVKRSAALYCSLSCRDARFGGLEERFWAKVDRRGSDECWPWLASPDANGYGRFHIKSRQSRPATQVAWEFANGRDFPSGMFACHRCDNPVCVNPAHIWPGTHGDNIRDAVAKGRMNAQRVTHCPKGHEYSPSNTLHAGSRRQCRECNRARWREWAAKRRAA
jgi:hypothetical protein